jgi:hypothetical protein
MALSELIAQLKAAQTPEPEDDDPPARTRVRKTLQAVILHLMKEGVPLELCAPLHHLDMALADISEGRFNWLLEPATMKPGTAKKRSHETLQWATAAAAVTVLKDVAKMNLTVALKEAAKAVGTEERKLAEFRKNLSKGRASDDARQQYSWAVNRFRKNSKGVSPDVLAAITITILRDLAEKG